MPRPDERPDPLAQLAEWANAGFHYGLGVDDVLALVERAQERVAELEAERDSLLVANKHIAQWRDDRNALRADLDAARAELAQRGEVVGWVVASKPHPHAPLPRLSSLFENRDDAESLLPTWQVEDPNAYVAEVRAVGDAGDGEGTP